MYRRTTAAAIGIVAIFALSACSDDDNDNEATPTPTATETETASPSPSASATEGEQGKPFEVVCPPPIGTVQVTTDESDMWAPGIVVGTGEDYWPVAFGEITFTNTDTGEKFIDPPITKPGVDPTGAVDCTFTQVVDTDENGEPIHGTVTGSVSVVAEEPVPSLPVTS